MTREIYNLPNHVTNRVIVTGPVDAVSSFRHRSIRRDGDEPKFDFNTLIPRPKILDNTTSGGWVNQGIALLEGDLSEYIYRASRMSVNQHGAPHKKKDLAKLNTREDWIAWAEVHDPQCVAEGRLALAAEEETGYRDWYTWCTQNWNTKWNAYDYREGDYRAGQWEFYFCTAWDTPVPIFKKACEIHWGIKLHVACYDEGGNFAGYGEFHENCECPFEFVDATDELYEEVYGEPPERYEDEEEMFYED